ncbi:hypothetical protein ONZ43_g1634 [Nemania bipapillata]|uniref:Uncharacterized protein n=1 Tax=Nemania bipapillata TaxID=110536 RepID=A0ACC2J3U7_9PEZI|nr:hypothetical protein ONZ43_g1634 [Nemania bipapillata]
MGEPILIGSVKPNIGHSESASSMATLIKAILALETGVIPPTAGISKFNTSIPWDEYNVKVVTKLTPIPSLLPFRRISVNAFGYAGTNAHAILDDARSAIPPGYAPQKHARRLEGALDTMQSLAKQDNRARPHLLLFSAHDEPTLRNILVDYSLHDADIDLLDLAYTLGTRRTKHAQRAFALGRQDSLKGDIEAASNTLTAQPKKPVVPAFVFTGQGAQWAVQIALVDLLASWGINPVATIGHSSGAKGEIAAAYAAGLISAEDAIVAAYHRGRVTACLPCKGAMLAVGVGEADAQKHINDGKFEGQLIVACHNSPSSSTISGDRDAIERLKVILDSEGVFARVLRTGGKAYHSHHMSAGAEYLNYLQTESRGNTTVVPKAVMFSTVDAKKIDSHTDVIEDAYWVNNLNSPVLFLEGMRLMLNEMPEINTTIEIGPHPALAGPLRQIFNEARMNITHLPTLDRTEHDVEQMLRLAGRLWTLDATLDVGAVVSVGTLTKDGAVETQTGCLLVDLPPYHWTYSKPCWSEPRQSREIRDVREPRHDILGRRIAGLSPLEPLWRNILRLKDLPWLVHHRFGGEFLLPAAAYIACATEAIEQLNAEMPTPLTPYSYTVRNIVLSSATVISDDDTGTETIFRLSPVQSQSGGGDARQWYQFVASCDSYGSWKETARGEVSLNYRSQSTGHRLKVPQKTSLKRHNHDSWMDKLISLGVDIGAPFRHISNSYTDGLTHTVNADIKISRTCRMMTQESRYVLHPTVLDACFQPILEAVHQGRLEDLVCGVIPTGFREVTLFVPSPEQLESACTLRTNVSRVGNRAFTSSASLAAEDDVILCEIVDMRTILYSAALPQEQSAVDQDKYLRIDWKLDIDYLSQADEEATEDPATVIDLVLHKNPAARVLALDTSLLPQTLLERQAVDLTICASLEAQAKFTKQYPDLEHVHFLDIDIAAPGLDETSTYDLIITKDSNCMVDLLPALNSRLATGGYIFVTGISDQERWSAGLQGTRSCGFKAVLSKETLLARAANLVGSVAGEQVMMLAELEAPLLHQLTDSELIKLVGLVEEAASICWVTRGGLLTGDHPELALAGGFGRVLRKELETLDFLLIDYDSDESSQDSVINLLLDATKRRDERGRNGETEYYVKNGSVYISRLVPHYEVNQNMVPNSGSSPRIQQRNRPAVRGEIINGRVLFRNDDKRAALPLGVDEVEVHIAAMGLTTMDGSDDANFLSHEFSGIVSRVGSEVTRVAPGMQVMGLAFDQLATFQRTHSSLVQTVPPSLSLVEAASLPSAFATASYALEELARVEKGETVLILDGLGPAGLVAVQLCRSLGLLPPKQVVLHPGGTTSSAARETIFEQGIDVIFGPEEIPLSSHPRLTLNPSVTYLLVGCLGGLGRQVALWMAERGAKHLTFISRSGSESPAAAETICTLENQGVETLVLRADITRPEEVVCAISQAEQTRQIRGVINAATVFHDAVFHNMKIDWWHQVVKTKVDGCLNLDNALKDRELDFFVMTSSVSSAFGTPGQANYAAANSVLDALARHRRCRGRPAVSLILPAIFGIGHIAENRHLEAFMKSRGMYGIDEQEMLDAFEIAMMPWGSLPEGTDHFIAGLQPHRLARAINDAHVEDFWRGDHRLDWLKQSVNRHTETGVLAEQGNSNKGMSMDILEVIQQSAGSGNEQHVVEMTTKHITKRLARLLVMEEDAMDTIARSVASHGLDSLIGAEFRNWIFREFKVEMPFQQLLSPSLTISGLAKALIQKHRPTQ